MTHAHETDAGGSAVSLDALSLSFVCPRAWDELEGDARERDCAHCDRVVHDLSARTRAEAQDLLARSQGRICATFVRAADGTVRTTDTDAGSAGTWRQRARHLGRRLARAPRPLAVVFAALAAACGSKRSVEPPDGAPGGPATGPEDIRLMGEVLAEPEVRLMGKVCVDPQSLEEPFDPDGVPGDE